MLVSALVLKIGYHNIGLAKSGSKGPSSESTIATDRLQVLGLIEKLEVVVKIGCCNKFVAEHLAMLSPVAVWNFIDPMVLPWPRVP